MKQKILFLCFISLSAMFSGAYAQTVEVKSSDDFTIYEPPASISVELITSLQLQEDNTTIPVNSEVKGKAC